MLLSRIGQAFLPRSNFSLASSIACRSTVPQRGLATGLKIDDDSHPDFAPKHKKMTEEAMKETLEAIDKVN